MGVFRKKTIDSLLNIPEAKKSGFTPTLGVWDLTALGVGAIIGTGIFVLTGLAAANYAGPGVVFSFILAGLISIMAALVYTELATALPVTGSAYTYSYVTLGEMAAWLVGWSLVMGYLVASGAVAIGWSSYVNDLLKALNVSIPTAYISSPFEGGVFNVMAALIVLVMSFFVVIGTQHSASANKIVVVAKLAAILLLLFVGFRHVDTANWRPFLPFGTSGVLKGTAIVFFAFIGFDVVATAVEEVKNPRRDMPRGIMYSLLISTVLYIGVSLMLTGMVKYTQLNTPSPMTTALLEVGVYWASALVSVGALAGLSSVLLVNMYGLSRVVYSMARDRLMPPLFSWVHPCYKTPVRATVMIALLVALIGGLLPIGLVAELANAGILFAFIAASVGVIILRKTAPDLERPFKVPWVPWLPLLTVISASYLMINLSALTLIRFASWMGIGLIIYFVYGYKRSLLAVERDYSRLPLKVGLPLPARKPIPEKENQDITKK